MPITDNRNLARSAFSALKWNYVGLFVRVTSSLAIGIVLARLLGPKPFGQVAIASLIIGLGTLMADFGFGAALIQKKQITDNEIRFVFTVQILLGAAFTLIGTAISGLIALSFHQPEVAPVLRVLMLTFLLQSLGQTASSLLRRDLKFKQIQLAQVGSYLVAYIAIGIPMGYMGFGVWALVAAQILQTFINSAMLYANSLHSIRPQLSFRHGDLVSFGSKVIGTNLASWAIYNLDTAIAGRYFGSYGLGLYNRAFQSATMIVNSAIVGLQQVLFPGTARANQVHDEKLKRVYMGALSLVGLAMMPLYVGIGVAPKTVVVALYGQQWAPCAPLLRAFAIAMPFYAMVCIAGPFLWGTDKVGREFKVQLIVGIVMVPSFLLASRFSLVCLAWSVAGIYFLRCVLITKAILDAFEIPVQSLMEVLYRPFGLSLMTGLAIYIVDVKANFLGPAIVKLLADVCVGIVVLSVSLITLRDHIYGPDGSWLLRTIRLNLPVVFRRFLPQ